MTSSETPASDAGTIEALKRIKNAESDWDHRLADARRASEATLRRQKEEAGATVAAARAEAEADHARTVERARLAADVEARQIVADGERQAAQATGAAAPRSSDRSAGLLKAVLGDLLEE